VYIRSIKVKNFRTLQRESGVFEMEFDSKFQIIAGANNSGKSNLLRSLNLFFNGCMEEDKPYSKERDLPFHKGKHGSGSPINMEIEVDLYLEDDEIKRIKDLNKFVITQNIIRTKRLFKEGESNRYFVNTDGKFPIGKNLEKNLISRSTDPLAVLFKRIKFIFIPTHTDLNQKINELVADEILPSMMDGWGNKGLAEEIKNLKGEVDKLDVRIKEILKQKNTLITKKFRETISEFKEIQAGIPIEQFTLEVALKDDSLTDILSKRIDLRITDSSHNTIDSKGSGIQKIALITLLEYFSQNIEDMARYTNPFLIWAIDEPESFMQPKLQKKLREILEKVSLTHQIIISTHSPQLINIIKPLNVKLFYLATEPVSLTRKAGKTFFKKETRFYDGTQIDFIEKIKEHLGIEINDGWLLQNRNILFEGSGDILYFHSTFKGVMGHSLSASNISCDGATQMPPFVEFLSQKIANKKLSLLCLLDNDPPGREAHGKIKSKKFLKVIKTISLYLDEADDLNSNYPSMIEDLVIPEIFFLAATSFLKKKNSKLKFDNLSSTKFIVERVKMKRTPMPEFLDNYFDSVIKNYKKFTFTDLAVKYGLALEYEDIISKISSGTMDSYKKKYPKITPFLSQFE
jgi:predicted ATP-dependent endonuclease of OLD family